MQITNLAVRRKHLTAVTFSEEYLPNKAHTDSCGLLVLDSEFCDEMRLKPGMSVTPEQIDELYYESECRRAKSKALWMLSRQDYPTGALKKKLAKDFGTDAAEFAVNRMCELGLINDRAYSERLAETLINSRGVSPRQAPYLMAQKGIDLSLAKEVVDLRGDDPKEVIKELITAKYSQNLGDEKGVSKTAAALQRKGFSFSDIRAVLRDFSNKIDEFGE